MSDSADFGQACFGSMNGWIEWEKMFFWKMVGPMDDERLAAVSFNRRSGPNTVVTPDSGRREIPMCLMFRGAHGDAGLRLRSKNGGNRQRVKVGHESDTAADGTRCAMRRLYASRRIENTSLKNTAAQHSF
jgi:hypothetical protein